MIAATVGLLLAAGCSSSRPPIAATQSQTNSVPEPVIVADTATDVTAVTQPTEAVEPTTPATEPTPSTLIWESCDDEMAQDPALECATLEVPLDYETSGGETIGIALVRYPAIGERIGAVLFNPGGPGGSGFDYIAQAGSAISSFMGLDSFDIIGFDPRGVDRSGGLRCQTDAELDAEMFLDDTPDTPEEQALLDATATSFSTACKAKYGDTLHEYSTANTARDMDAMRVAFGDEQISFIGISYGTYLGAVYATMFPDQVRALVLDSAYEPGGDTLEQQYTTQLVGFENAFNDWAAWCAETPDECAFAQGGGDVGARVGPAQTEPRRQSGGGERRSPGQSGCARYSHLCCSLQSARMAGTRQRFGHCRAR